MLVEFKEAGGGFPTGHAWGRPLLLQRRAGRRAAHTLHTEWQLWRLGGAVCRSEQLMLLWLWLYSRP